MKLQTFIFVHNQDIILDYIKYNKFNNLSNLIYVFLGDKDISKIQHLDNVIVARNLKYNMEEYPKLTSFSGWYALWKNNLINCEYFNLFEYDVNVDDNLEHIILDLISKNPIDVIGYIPFNVHRSEFLGNNPWGENLIFSLKKEYNIDILNFIRSLPPNKECSMTSNHTFSKKTFDMYMEWMDKMIENIRTSGLSGHQAERSISVFYLLHNLNYHILKNVLHHFQFDSHQTQGIGQEKFINNYKNLVEN